MEKTIFSQQEQVEQQDAFIAKQEFREEQAVPDTDADNVPLEGELLEAQFEQSVQPAPRWWKRALIGTALLFFTATVAQSVQWLVDTWQQNQWIYFAFSLVLCLAVLLGISAIIGEWRCLVQLRKRGEMQHQSREWLESAVVFHGVFTAPSFSPSSKILALNCKFPLCLGRLESYRTFHGRRLCHRLTLRCNRRSF